MEMQIDSTNRILLNSKQTQYHAKQSQNGTEVYSVTGNYITMPMSRYTLSTIEGIETFKNDFLDTVDNPFQINAAGRPPTVEGRKVTVYLDESSLAKAANLGDGNVSAGIRLALTKL